MISMKINRLLIFCGALAFASMASAGSHDSHNKVDKDKLMLTKDTIIKEVGKLGGAVIMYNGVKHTIVAAGCSPDGNLIIKAKTDDSDDVVDVTSVTTIVNADGTEVTCPSQ